MYTYKLLYNSIGLKNKLCTSVSTITTHKIRDSVRSPPYLINPTYNRMCTRTNHSSIGRRRASSVGAHELSCIMSTAEPFFPRPRGCQKAPWAPINDETDQVYTGPAHQLLLPIFGEILEKVRVHIRKRKLSIRAVRPILNAFIG